MHGNKDPDQVLWEDILVELSSMNPFCDILYLYIKKSKVQHTLLAEKLFVTPSTISNWLKGIRLPRATILPSLEDALNLNAQEREFLFYAYRATHEIKNLSDYVEGAGPEKFNRQLKKQILPRIQRYLRDFIL